MAWLFVAISSYFCFALSAVFVKYLISKTSFSPKTFVFYIGILGMLIFFLIPFVDFSIPSVSQIALSILAGLTLAYSTFCLLKGLQKFEASRIIPVMGAFVPLLTFLLIYIVSGGKETFLLSQVVAFLLLVGGIILLTAEKNVLLNGASLGVAFASAFFLALSFVATKYVYVEQPFWSGLILMRIGGFILSVWFFLSSKEVRSEVFSQKQQTHTPVRKNIGTFFVFLLSQVIGASAEILRNLAIFLVPLAMLPLINALQGIEYLFLFIFVFFMSRYSPRVLKEEATPRIVWQKVVAMGCIIGGLVIIALA